LKSMAVILCLSSLLALGAGCDGSSYPFDQVTDPFTFTYTLPSAGTVDILVLNCYMSTVRTLVSGESQESGEHASGWDLQDTRGELVPEGLYYVRVWLEGEPVGTLMYEVYR